MIYKIDQDIFEVLQDETPENVTPCFDRDGEYFIDSNTMENLKEKGIDLDSYIQYFVDPSTVLTDYLNLIKANVESYKVYALLSDTFKEYPVSCIDFKRHLKSDISLNKKIEKELNGRPKRSSYFYDDQLICWIDFEFKVNDDNLVIERNESLTYLMIDETDGDPILIKAKKYDLTDLNDGESSIKERMLGRQSIMDSLHVFMAGVIQAYNPDIDYIGIVTIVKPYWDECEKKRHDFVDLGTLEWEEELIALKIAGEDATIYKWLFLDTGLGMLIIDYLIYRVSY